MYKINEMYDFTKACELLHIARVTLYGWIKTGKIKSIRPGKKHLIPGSEIKRLLELGK